MYGIAGIHAQEALDPAKVSALNAQQNMIVAGIAVDKARLLEDKSTENVDVHVVEQVVNKFDKAKGSIDELIADRAIDKD